MSETSQTTQSSTYLWCDHCRRSFRHGDAPDGTCPLCSEMVRPMGKFTAIVRGLMSNELVASELQTKHRQLIRIIWTRNVMGERYYRIIEPDLPYSRFESRVTELLCQGAEQGWVRFIFPPGPWPDEAAYRMEFIDEDRFVAELEALFGPASVKTPVDAQ